MPAAVRPSLDYLRTAEAPAWLWDAERRRIVWANQAGLQIFGCQSVFELVDKPFDGGDQGVERLAGLLADLSWNEPRRVLLHLPSSGNKTPFSCDVFIHSLADGRAGLLAVVQNPQAPGAEGTSELFPAHAVVDALPLAAAVVSPGGDFLRHNAAMSKLLKGNGAAGLSHFLPVAGDRQDFLGTGSSGLAEHLATFAYDGRMDSLRLRLSPVASLGSGNMLLLIGPATQEGTKSATPAAPALAPKNEAFAALSKKLSDNLRARPAEKLSQQPLPAVPAQAAPISATAFATIPRPIRLALEQAPHGIIVSRNGKVLYANAHAAELLGQEEASALASDATLLAGLAAASSGGEGSVALKGPALLSVAHHPMPWHNGPAEQFTLKPLATEAAPKVHEQSAAGPAPSQSPISEWPPVATTRKPAAVEPLSRAAAQPSLVPSQSAPETSEAIALDELKAILDVASDGIITLGREGEILSFSAAAEAIFGLSTREATGKPLHEMLHAESRRPFQDYLAGMRGTGLAVVFNDGREMLAINAQGGEVPLFVTIGKLQSPRSKAAFCAVVRDLTPWKRGEKELLEARDRALASSRQKSDFLALISHELRTPLNAILGFSEVMRTERFGPVGNDKYLAYANDIHASGSHLLSIVNDLLDLSKVEAGKLELDFMAVNLEEVADYALNLLQDEASLSGIVLRKSMPSALPRVVGDQKSLRQVMINLVSNGIKYTDAGGEVMVSAAMTGDGSLALRVKDNGIGMSTSQLEEALSPFGRIENAQRPRLGTGLGLPLTKSLVEANRATFTLSSSAGKGTLAEILFPGPRVLAE